MPRKSPAPRTSILHVRLSPAERRVLQEVADREFLKESAWARRALLQALQAAVRGLGPGAGPAGASEAAPATPGRA